jgi:hypothetical protein
MSSGRAVIDAAMGSVTIDSVRAAAFGNLPHAWPKHVGFWSEAAVGSVAYGREVPGTDEYVRVDTSNSASHAFCRP